jgi:hypothetical protein
MLRAGTRGDVEVLPSMTDIRMTDTAGHWRQSAQETRADADRQADPEIKKTLLEIAQLYDQLAALAEKRVAS